MNPYGGAFWGPLAEPQGRKKKSEIFSWRCLRCFERSCSHFGSSFRWVWRHVRQTVPRVRCPCSSERWLLRPIFRRHINTAEPQINRPRTATSVRFVPSSAVSSTWSGSFFYPGAQSGTEVPPQTGPRGVPKNHKKSSK